MRQLYTPLKIVGASRGENAERQRALNSFPLRDCVTMHEGPMLVISSGARDLAFSATCEEKISRLGLEMTIATQSLTGKVR